MRDFTLDEIKELIGTTVKAPPTGDPFIDDRYANHIAQFNHPFPYWRVFYHLARELRPALTVELGAWQGTCAAHIAAGWPQGDVITIDSHIDPGDDVHKAKTQEAENRYPNLTYLQGRTWDVVDTVKIVAKNIDILFIDSWHQYNYAKKDFEDYSPLVSKPGLIICDDILGGDGPVIAGMLRFWEELPGEKYLDDRPHPGFPMGFLKWE